MISQDLTQERPKVGRSEQIPPKTALVQLNIARLADDSEFTEFCLLAEAAGAEIVHKIIYNRSEIESRLFIGKGQAEALAQAVKALNIELVIFNAKLSPAQERNLERLLSCRVLDRSGLVLDIFAQRARSHVGKLQVELAQLKHLSTRLVRGWTHLERQKGGIGLRGPGETQLETDRRLIGERIKQLQNKLAKVNQQRQQLRQARRGSASVALAGYTNSGKSTLFNALTRADVLAKDQLFATLDPTWRKLNHAGKELILLADTVGFVSDLPHELVEAFHSTLEESVHADLILLVIDVADDERDKRISVVESVLAEIGADEVPCIRVFNKIDKSAEHNSGILYDENGEVLAVFVSALTGEGLEDLQKVILNFFQEDNKLIDLKVPTEFNSELSALIATCYREQLVVAEKTNDDGSLILQLKLSEKRLLKLQSEYNQFFISQ